MNTPPCPANYARRRGATREDAEQRAAKAIAESHGWRRVTDDDPLQYGADFRRGDWEDT